MSEIVASIVVMMMGLFLSAFCLYAWNNSTCGTRADKMGFQHDYGWQQGCMIRVKDRWIPIESYRTLEGSHDE